MEHSTFYRTIDVDGLNIFYREAGPKDALPGPLPPSATVQCSLLNTPWAQERARRRASASRRPRTGAG